jgi:hypothetical protein
MAQWLQRHTPCAGVLKDIRELVPIRQMEARRYACQALVLDGQDVGGQKSESRNEAECKLALKGLSIHIRHSSMWALRIGRERVVLVRFHVHDTFLGILKAFASFK